MQNQTKAESVLAPDYTAAGNLKPELLNGAGAQTSTVAMTVGEWATLQNANAVEGSLRFGATAAGLTAVVTDPSLPPGKEYNWYVKQSSRFVSVIARDGVSVIDASIWRSSGA